MGQTCDSLSPVVFFHRLFVFIYFSPHVCSPLDSAALTRERSGIESGRRRCVFFDDFDFLFSYTFLGGLREREEQPRCMCARTLGNDFNIIFPSFHRLSLFRMYTHHPFFIFTIYSRHLIFDFYCSSLAYTHTTSRIHTLSPCSAEKSSCESIKLSSCEQSSFRAFIVGTL